MRKAFTTQKLHTSEAHENLDDFQRYRSMFQFLIYVKLSRSMAAILEMPQYVAYQTNVYALLTIYQILQIPHNDATFLCLAALKYLQRTLR